MRGWIVPALLAFCSPYGCVGDDDAPPDMTGATGGPDEQPDWSGFGPRRTDWETEVDAAFPEHDALGDPAITSIVVGGPGAQNFANQGDVIVTFDAEPGRIQVALRRFTFSDSDEAAQEDFDRLHAWAYVANTPRPPDDMSLDADCSSTWQNGCQIRVWYDGMYQPVRTGADIHLRLPASYRHDITVQTEDVVAEDSYLLRGNVCIEDLPGTANVELESGVAMLRLASDITPGPTCTADEIEACDAAGWDPGCPCATYGRSEIGGRTANAFIDMPANLWAAVTLENTASDPSACGVDINVPGVEIDPSTTDDPGRTRGFLNHPGPDAIVGGGYSIAASADDCAPVWYTPYPAAWPGDGNASLQRSEIRGNLLTCTGCLQTMDCKTLLEEL